MQYQSGRISGMTDTAGSRTTSYGYTGSDLTSFTDAATSATQLSYDGNHNLTKIIDPAKNELTTLSYDAYHRVTELDFFDSVTGNTYKRHYTYNPPSGGNPASTVVEDEDGHNTTFYYDGQGRVTKAVDARGLTQSIGYNADSNVTQWQDDSQNTTSASYDTATGENLQQLVQPTGASTTWQYNNAALPNDPTQLQEPQGSTFTAGYDGNGNATSDQNQLPANNTVTAYYNGNGTEIGYLDAKSTAACTPVTHNPTTTVPSQITVCYGYDGTGNRTSATYPAPLGGWSFTADAVSRVHQAVDGKNQTTTYTFDSIDRTKEIDYADGSKIVQVFDADGDVTKLTDSTGSTTYTYDGLNRRLTENPPSGDSEPPWVWWRLAGLVFMPQVRLTVDCRTTPRTLPAVGCRRRCEDGDGCTNRPTRR